MKPIQAFDVGDFEERYIIPLCWQLLQHGAWSIFGCLVEILSVNCYLQEVVRIAPIATLGLEDVK